MAKGFNFHSHVLVMTLVPFAVFAWLFVFGILCDAIDLHRMDHDRLPRAFRVDFAGFASALARIWPDCGPSWPANLVKWMMDDAMGMSQPGAAVRANWLLCYFVMPPAFGSCVRLFVCARVDQKSYLEADYSIDCGSAAHRRMQVFAGCMMMFCLVAVPCMMFNVLRPFRKHINPPKLSDEEALTARKNNVLLRPVLAFVKDWRPHCWCVYAQTLKRDERASQKRRARAVLAGTWSRWTSCAA